MSIGRFALKHSRGILAVAIFFALLGAAAAPRLPVAILPDFPYPRIAVIADAGDMAIDAVVLSITRPLESAVSTVPGVTRVRSRTARGSVEMSVDFEWNQDMFQALTYLRSSIDAVRADLPDGVELTVERTDPSSFPVIGYSMTSDTVDQAELREVADLLIAPTLSRLDGVYRVMVQGGDVREFAVTVDPARLAAHGVSGPEVAAAIQGTNVVASVGRFDRRYLKYLVVGTSEMRSRDDVLNAVVAVRGGSPVRVRDVADVNESTEEKITAVTANGKDAVLFSILKQRGASTVQVSQEIEASLAELASGVPEGVEIRPFYDESHLLQESIGSVRDSIVIGGILAVVVLIVFLGSFRTSAVVICTIPVTMLITLLVLRAFGQTLNLMTLGGLAVGLGLIIDDVVVTVENIHRHVQGGAAPEAATMEGMREIAKPMIGSSLTTICVFIPLLALGGIAGAFFSPLALTLTTMLIVSMVLALTLAPALSGRLIAGGSHRANGAAEHTSRFLEALRGVYAKAVRAVLRYRWVALIGAAGLALGALLLGKMLPTGFMPEMDEGALILDYLMEDGTSLAETDRQLRIVERILMEQPEVAAYSRRTGMELGFFATEQNTGDIAIMLKPRSQRERSSDEIISAVRERCLQEVPGMECEFIQIVQDRVNDMAGEPNPVEVKIFGDDPARLREIAEQVTALLESVPGVVDLTDGIVASGPEFEVRIDPEKAARAGFTSNDVIEALNTSMFGQGESVIRRGERLIRVRVTYPPRLRDTEEKVRALRLVSPDGSLVPLTSVATLSEQEGSPEQERENQKPVVAVTAGLEGVDLGTAIRTIQGEIGAKIDLPDGYTIQYGGLYQTQQQSFRRLLAVFVLGMALVLVVAICQYETLAEPLALFISAMFSIVGVILALFLTNTPFNASSFTGAIMVFGMVLTNGIVLMDYIRIRTASGMELVEAVIDAGRTRVRPVLMTSTIAILALLPLALGIGAGAEMQKPLAVAVIGGLATSPVFALLLAPVVLVIIRHRRRKRSA